MLRFHVSFSYTTVAVRVISPPLILLSTASRKAFSLTLMHRNRYTGRSSAAGLLPQAQASRSPGQPRHSNGQHRDRVSRAAALSHGPAALNGGRAYITATTVPSFNRPSLFSSLFVYERAIGYFSSWLLFVPLIWENVDHCDSWGSERLIPQSMCQKPI